MAFTTVCHERGYSKTGKIREFIRNMVKAEIGEAELSAKEWKGIQAGMREIDSGRYATLKEMKRDLARRRMADKQDRQSGAPGDRGARPGNAR